MALGDTPSDALDIGRMMRGEYGSRADLPPPPTAPAPEPQPYVAPATPGGFVDELLQGGPAPRPADQPTRTAGQTAYVPVKTKMAQDIAAENGLDLDAPPRNAKEAAQHAEIRRADEAAFRMGAPAAVDTAAKLSQRGGDAFDEAFARAGEQVRLPSRANPKRPIVEKGSSAAQAAIGEQRVAAEQVGQATISQEQAIAEELARQGLRNEIELSAMQDRERMIAERQAAQVAAVQEAEQRVKKASADLARKPDIDPGRFWASRTAGQKAGFIITAILGGIGGVDTTGLYADAVARDIDAQKANIDKATGVRDAAEAEFDVARRTFGEMLALTQDQRAAEAMYEASRWEAAKADLAAKAAEFGVPLTEARVAQSLAEFDERIAEATMRWQSLVAATPVRIGGGVRSPYTPLQQKMLAKQAETGLSGQQKFAEQAIGIAGEQETEQIRSAGRVREKEAEAGVKAAERRAEQQAKADEDVLKNSRDWGTVEQMTADFLEKYQGDIPGVGLPLTGSRQERISVDSFNTLLPQMLIKAITGANFSPEQGEAAMRLAEGSWDEMTDEDKRSRIRAINNLASSQRRYLQSSLEGRGASTKTAAPIAESPTEIPSFQPE